MPLLPLPSPHRRSVLRCWASSWIRVRVYELCEEQLGSVLLLGYCYMLQLQEDILAAQSVGAFKNKI